MEEAAVRHIETPFRYFIIIKLFGILRSTYVAILHYVVILSCHNFAIDLFSN